MSESTQGVIHFYSTTGEFGCFSNFSRHPVFLKGKRWPTSEHYFQAQKFAGTEHEERVRLCKTPRAAADLGRSRKLPLRRDWEGVKDRLMREAVLAKFTQHADLRAVLLGTGDAELVEHTSNDSYWGDGGDGSGRNVLGRILMSVRDELRRRPPAPGGRMSPRDAFLDAVRRAVAAGNRPGDSAPPPDRGAVGYQGAGPDPVARFRDELAAAGGFPHVVADAAAAAARVLSLVHEKGARRVLLGRGDFLDSLGLAGRLRELGVEVVAPDGLTPQASREPFFAADLGVTGVDHLVAETGSVILFAGPAGPRSLSLLPPVHVAVAHAGQLLPDLFDLFGPGGAPPSCLTIITGPSKTGDIELKLVTGVHGPGELHVVVAGSGTAHWHLPGVLG